MRLQQKIILTFIVFGVAIIALNSCRFKRDENLTQPTAVQDCGEFFCYQASETNGVTITVDLSQNHIAGQPYGNWFIKAVWRTPEEEVVAKEILPLTIDADGTGTAYITPDFLEALFDSANVDYTENEDLRLYLKKPGLMLGVFPDEATWQYYSFR